MKRLLFVCTFIFAAAATFAVDIGTALDQAAEQFSSTLRTGTSGAVFFHTADRNHGCDCRYHIRYRRNV